MPIEFRSNRSPRCRRPAFEPTLDQHSKLSRRAGRGPAQVRLLEGVHADVNKDGAIDHIYR
jgi:hypothetical protein